MRRTATVIIFSLVGLLLVLVPMAGYLLLSESGLQLVWGQLSSATGESLTARRIEGRLAGMVRLEDVSFTGQDFQLGMQELQLDWEPLAMLRGMLHIERLEVQGLRYVPLDQGGDTTDRAVSLPGRVSLPLGIRLAALEIHEAEFSIAPGESLLAIQQATLTGEIKGTLLELDNFSLQAPAFALQGRARMETAGVYPVEGLFDWHAAPQGYAGLQATTRLGGSLQRLLLESDLAAPYSASAEITLEQPMAELLLDARLTLQDTDLACIQEGWPELRLTGSLRAGGKPEQLQLAATLEGETPETGPLTAEFGGQLQPGTLQVHSLRVAAEGRDAALQASGSLDYADPQPVVDLQASWQKLAWPLQGTAAVHSAEGQLMLSGSAEAYTIAAAAALEATDYPAGHVHLAGQGNQQSLHLAELGLEILEGRLEGSGHIEWAGDLMATLKLRGEQINPAEAWPAWPGQLGIELQTEILKTGEDWAVSFDTARVSGTLRGVPLLLEARGRYQPGQVQLEDSRLISGPSRLHFDGEIGERLALEWEVDSPDLATLLPDAAGSLNGRGAIHGSPTEPRLQALLSGNRLRYRADSLDRLSVDTRIDMSGGQESSLVMAGVGGTLRGIRIRRIELRGKGHPQAHRLELVAQTGKGELDMLAEGEWVAPDWHYRLTRSVYTTPDKSSRWKLQQPVAGLVGRTQATLPESCWRSGRALACLQGQHGEAESNAALKLEHLPLASFVDSQETGVSVTGTLDAKAQFHRRAGKPPLAQLQLNTSPGEIYSEAAGDAQELLATGAGSLRLEVQDDSATLDASLPLAKGGGGLYARAAIATSARPWGERRLQGELDITLDNISFADALSTEINGLYGRIEGRVNLTGVLARPHLQGRLQLHDAGLDLATPGLALRELGVSITGGESGELSIDGRVRSGEGVLSMTGRASLVEMSASLQIRGEGVQVMNTPEAEIHASPDLSLLLTGSRIDLTGEVHVPYARIEPRELPESAVTVSSDQVIVTESGPLSARAPYSIYSRVRFILGDEVTFDGLGLSGRLQGNVLTRSEPDRPASATGELGIVKGRYRAYGQDLEIRTGRLLFAGGALAEPGLDVEAVRRPTTGILVGVRVRGTLLVPRLTVFSEPGMPQSLQLSWLILGRDLERNTSDEEKSAMNEAAMMLGLSGSEVLGKQLGERIGVDEVTVASESDGTTTQASLLVGKYLTPELFVSYGLGIFEPVSTLRLLYTLSSNWKLVGEASALRSAADIFYVIERGE